jgi:signal transduction histidine kinase/ActR/RegA family two-component response regulator
VFPEDIGGNLNEAIKRVQETRSLVNMEYSVAKQDSEHFYEARLLPLLESQIIIIIRDITERKKLEAQFIQAQKMEAIGTLAGGIAHDFNNLMMGIQGHTSLMLCNMEPGHPHHEKLRIIEDQVKSAAELTRQLLGFARRGKYEIKPINLNVILERTSTMFGRTRREITVHRKFQNDLWIAEVDRGQIEQVLLNIYVNAWQAMPGGGDLFLETKNVIVDERFEQRYSVKPGKYVKASVTDTGVGMDEMTRNRIFEPFFTTKEMGRGTGLGLASAYGIIKSHGGFINVYSEKGHGTTFGIYLPVSAKEVPAEKLPTKEILKGYETILLVDDEEMVINVSREILDTLGYRVIVARNGQEAIDIYKARQEEIDLVILDMIMPGMGGSETFNVLKEINPRIKVILSSGYSIDGRPANMLDRGCRAFIQKPYSMGDLSQKIRGVLDMRSACD